MDLDPMESASAAGEEKTSSRDRASARLTTWVAITVALLATFLGVCKVKDDNIVQAMQQAQVDKLDHWAFYQARNLREEVAKATATQLRLAAASAPVGRQAEYREAIDGVDAQALALLARADSDRRRRRDGVGWIDRLARASRWAGPPAVLTRWALSPPAFISRITR